MSTTWTRQDNDKTVRDRLGVRVRVKLKTVLVRVTVKVKVGVKDKTKQRQRPEARGKEARGKRQETKIRGKARDKRQKIWQDKTKTRYDML